MANETPMMRQFFRIKRRHPDAILFFRMGDFYEMFGEDAVLAARVLDIALTTRDREKADPVPMCGVPHHAAESYIARLIKEGYKVAVCEQMEDPRKVKGIVKRDVIRVITPGTFADESYIEAGENRFLVSLYRAGSLSGLGVVDVTTGEFYASEFNDAGGAKRLGDELEKMRPREVIVPRGMSEELAGIISSSNVEAALTPRDDWTFDYEVARASLLDHFKTVTLDGFGLEDRPAAVSAMGALLKYLQETQKASLPHIGSLSYHDPSDHLVMDARTQKNLELFETVFRGRKEGTLLWVLDRTKTSMGGRLLKGWISRPLVDIQEISRRQAAVEELVRELTLRENLQEHLSSVHDLERLTGRVAMLMASAGDLLSLKESLSILPPMGGLLQRAGSEKLCGYRHGWDDLKDVHRLIDAAIDEGAASATERGIIKDGYRPELDELRSIAKHGKDWIARLEARERERSGIPTLKVRYNKVFGYYIEVTRKHLPSVPEDYVRKQTLVNAERFVTEELKEYEEKVLGAEEEMASLEGRIFGEVLSSVAAETRRIQTMAQYIAELDVLCSLAEAAHNNAYVRPEVNDGDAVRIVEGRHPVLERVPDVERFVPNDLLLDKRENQILIVTGPNMAGKSTYMRQVALIVIMAQMGGFVPASSAEIGIVDRIFTRIGASDDLIHGLSTFMVEMNEAANIVHNATARSLIIMDEVGRGTSTYDGVSIAWAMVEHLHDHMEERPRTLFATHYNELTNLARNLRRVKNLNVMVRELEDRVLFLRKVVEGSADKSYGIQVARLAGLPALLLHRADEILSIFEKDDQEVEREVRFRRSRKRGEDVDPNQLNLFIPDDHGLRREILSLDIERLTPLDALNKLRDIQRKLRDS